MSSNELPRLVMSQPQLQLLISAMLAYKHYLWRQEQLSEEQRQVLLILAFFLPKLYECVCGRQETTTLWLLVQEVQVMKTGLAALLRALQDKQPSATVTKALIAQQIQKLVLLKASIEQTFPAFGAGDLQA